MKKELLANVYQSLITPDSNYIKTGYTDIDSILAPYSKGTFVLVGGRPSMGKTTFMSNIMEQFLKSGKRCLYYSLAQSSENFVKRLIVQKSGVSLKGIKNKALSVQDVEKIKAAKDELETYDLHVYDDKFIDSKKIEDLVKSIRPDYIFVDNIQDFFPNKVSIAYFIEKLRTLAICEDRSSKETEAIYGIINRLKCGYCEDEDYITPEHFEDIFDDLHTNIWRYFSNPISEVELENLYVDYMAEKLKSIALKYELIVFVGTQLARTVELRETRRPKLPDIKSRCLLNKSDVIMFLYRDSYYDRNISEQFEKEKLEVIFEKNPLGHIGSAVLNFDTSTLKLLEPRLDII